MTQHAQPTESKGPHERLREALEALHVGVSPGGHFFFDYHDGEVTKALRAAHDLLAWLDKHVKVDCIDDAERPEYLVLTMRFWKISAKHAWVPDWPIDLLLSQAKKKIQDALRADG
jgi:hypothetical protein